MQPGPYIVNWTLVSSGMFANSHSVLSFATPSSGSSVCWKLWMTSIGSGLPSSQNAPVVVWGTTTRPSICSGATPASSIACRSA